MDANCTSGSSMVVEIDGKNVTTKYCLQRGENIGLALTAESGLISLAAIFVLFILIIRNVYRNNRRPVLEQRRLLQEPADVLMLSLFAADLLQAIGAALDIRWSHQGFVQIGGFCTAQGVIQQLGETTVAMSTLVIALQTFLAIWFRKFVHNMKAAYACVIIVWLFVILYVALGTAIHRKEDYMDPTPYWCWIGENFLAERITGEYFWMWSALLVSVFVYIPLFLWSRGYMTVDKTNWWNVKLRLRSVPYSEEANARDRPPLLSLTILGYPVVYSIVILPLSVVRWITFHRGKTVPASATFSVIFLFGLSGAANVILLLTTRPNLLLFDSEPASATSGAARDMEMNDAGSATGAARGRIARRRIAEQGRIATPSRSSSRLSEGALGRGNYGAYSDYDEIYASGNRDRGEQLSQLSEHGGYPSDTGELVLPSDVEPQRHQRISDSTQTQSSYPTQEHEREHERTWRNGDPSGGLSPSQAQAPLGRLPVIITQPPTRSGTAENIEQWGEATRV